MVFILCVCAFPIFSSCNWFLVSYHCGRKQCFELFPDKLLVLLVVSGFFLVLSNQMEFSLLFSLCLTFTVSTKNREKFTFTVKRLSLCGSTPVQPVCAQCGFGERAEFDVNTVMSFLMMCCQLSPWRDVELEWPESETSMSQGLPSAQWLYCPLWAGSGLALLGVELLRLLWAGSVPLRCVPSLSQHWHPCPGVEPPHRLQGALGIGWGGLWPSDLLQDLNCFGCSACVSINHGCFCPAQMPVWVRVSPLCLRGFCDTCLGLGHANPQCGATWVKPAGLEHSLGLRLGYAPRQLWEASQPPPNSLPRMQFSCLGIKQGAWAAHKQSLDFSQPSS